jgi:hypothetical protein
LTQVICGLLSYLVVENLQVTMQDALLFNEFVIMTLATSAPGKMTHLNGTVSAAAGVDSRPVITARREMAGRDLMRFAKLFTGRPSQCVVDPVLPARPAFLEVRQHILIDPQ